MLLREANAVVTGAANGLGLAAARRLSAEGARVVLADIDGEAAIAAARAIDPSGSGAMGLRCDVTLPADCAALVDRAERFFGAPVDVFLANAGTTLAGPLTDADPDAVRRTIEVNVLGSLYSAQAALRSLRRSKRASLIFTSSLQAVTGRFQRSVYTTSKHALTGLVKSLALEFGPEGVRVNAVAPSAIDTALLRRALGVAVEDIEEIYARMAASLPLRRMPTPTDFADAVVFLASSSANCITGQVLVLDCGASAGFGPPPPR